MVDRIIYWFLAHVFDREGERRLQEEFAKLGGHRAMMAQLDKRIAEVFTKEEWAETEARCRREHPECF